VAIVAVLAGLTWWAIDSQSASTPSADATAAPSAEASAVPTPSLPAGADPQLGIKPEVAKPSGTVSALNVTTLITGTGAAVANGQKITVNYTGVAFNTGEEFDSSWKAGGQPFSFTLGQGGVIKGWDQGLVGVTVGSRVQIDIPADLAYGDSPQTGYPAGALRFVVDVLSAA
jgi:peptidylprolyl isomerase